MRQVWYRMVQVGTGCSCALVQAANDDVVKSLSIRVFSDQMVAFYYTTLSKSGFDVSLPLFSRTKLVQHGALVQERPARACTILYRPALRRGPLRELSSRRNHSYDFYIDDISQVETHDSRDYAFVCRDIGVNNYFLTFVCAAKECKLSNWSGQFCFTHSMH